MKWAVVAAMVLVASGCSLLPSSPAGSSPQQSGYLDESPSIGTDGSWVIFFDPGSHLWYSTERVGDNVAVLNGTAQRSGSTLTVNISRFAQTGNLLPGGIYAVQDQPGGLTLSVPMSDGTVHAYSFHSASVSDYNADVRKMHTQIARIEAGQAKAAHQAAQQQSSRWAAVEVVEQRSCTALGGRLKGAGGPNTDGTQDPILNWCEAGPGRTWVPGRAPGDNSPISCDGLIMNFQADGTVSQPDFQAEQSNHPGCFG
jgi:hypothetical protein